MKREKINLQSAVVYLMQDGSTDVNQLMSGLDLPHYTIHT